MKTRNDDFRVDFHQGLKRFRAEIDAVAAEYRPGLHQLADQIEQRQQRLVADYATACDLADELNLRMASGLFDLWACSCDAEHVRQMLCRNVT
jgi:hypothetical protein